MDPRIARTRQSLQAALFELARERGLDEITVADIAERAGVNRSSFYQHYSDKDTLLADAIDAVATDRTLIVIAHRLSTVVDSDHIVVMDHGQVVGQGTHSDLVDSTPLYRDLAQHQLLV